MSTLDPPRAYRILGLAPGARPEEVKAAYRDLAQVWHPDRFRENPRLVEKAARNLQRINDAYAVLKDYSPPASRLPPLPRDSISALLGLGDLRDSAAFRVPAAAVRRSWRVLMSSTPDESTPPLTRILWWVVAFAAVATLVGIAVLLVLRARGPGPG